MNQNTLREYAELIVKVGANVQPGQKVRLWINTDRTDLAEYITEACYKAGAKYVELIWENSAISRLHYTYASVETLGTVLPWEEAREQQMVEDLPVRIIVESADPDELNCIPADVLSTVSAMRRKVTKQYRDAIDNKHQWVIVAAASKDWAVKVFPDLPAEEAEEALWDLILSCTRATGADPEAEWKEHTDTMAEKAAWLNSLHLRHLHYESKNGTCFDVDLIPGAEWHGARDVNRQNGAVYVPNMPTEEVFTSPLKGHCEGRLVATKPLSWSGQLIEDFYVDFKDGRVYSCGAKSGEEILKKMFSMDEGASMLGEVALVPKESPVNLSGKLFYNTLFDENACCHVAVGMGFEEVIPGFEHMSKEELAAVGINDSLIHTDFMIGAEDLSVTGTCENGELVPIFRDGTWAVG